MVLSSVWVMHGRSVAKVLPPGPNAVALGLGRARGQLALGGRGAQLVGRARSLLDVIGRFDRLHARN
jgi:hypothetical protein